MVFIGINYDDIDIESYEGITVTRYKVSSHEFNTKNFVKDWFDAIQFIQSLSEVEKGFAQMSSVDHFFMDGAEFDKSYLVKDFKENLYLSYDDEDYENGATYYVPKGTTPTWEELKELCK